MTWRPHSPLQAIFESTHNLEILQILPLVPLHSYYDTFMHIKSSFPIYGSVTNTSENPSIPISLNSHLNLNKHIASNINIKNANLSIILMI